MATIQREKREPYAPKPGTTVTFVYRYDQQEEKVTIRKGRRYVATIQKISDHIRVPPVAIQLLYDDDKTVVDLQSVVTDRKILVQTMNALDSKRVKNTCSIV